MHLYCAKAGNVDRGYYIETLFLAETDYDAEKYIKEAMIEWTDPKDPRLISVERVKTFWTRWWMTGGFSEAGYNRKELASMKWS